MSFEKHEKNDIIYYTSSLFDSFGIPHFFASKHGGKSSGAFFSLNISTSRKDEKGIPDRIENVRKNLELGLELVGSCEEKACMMKQIHSSKIENAKVSCFDAFDGKGDFQPCDGVFTSRGALIDTLCVKTADCVPVLLYDTKNDVAMALHAGWRGTVENICGNAVRKLKALHPDANIIAAIGPCILDCCYEVNSTVYEAAMKNVEENNILSNNVAEDSKLSNNVVETCNLSKNVVEPCILSKNVEKCFTKRYFSDGEQKFRVSLPALNRLFLESAGVSADNIDEARLCTCCHADESGSVFFSHRASGGFSGTQMSVLRLRNQDRVFL